MSATNKLKENLQNYEVLPPDGGYGYVIAANLMIILLLGWFSVQSFGVIFEEFLAVLGMLRNTLPSFAQYILQCSILQVYQPMYFCRNYPTGSGVLGCVAMYFRDYFNCICDVYNSINIYVWYNTRFLKKQQRNIKYKTPTCSGQGILYCCGCAQFNEYFHLRKSFVMNALKALTGVGVTCFPTLTMISLDGYGFRGTLAIVAAGSLHLLFVALCFQPVKWHAKKRHMSVAEIVSKSILHSNTVEAEEESLLDNMNSDKTGTENVESNCNFDNGENEKLQESKVRTVCCSIYSTLDLELFTDPKYINLTLGVALGFGGDGLFSSFLPLLLNNAGFYENDVTILMTVFATFDLIGKVSLCILSGFVNIKSRYLQLIYAVVTATFRLGFVLSNSFGWIALILAVLGFVRCLIYNTLPLVFAEIYPKRYITSLTLSMVVNSLVALIFGQIIGLATTLTPNKNVILYILSTSSAIYATTWTIELLFSRGRKK